MEKTRVYPKEPELNGIFKKPIWWHHHGDKMSLVNISEDKRSLILEGSAARLEVVYSDFGDDCKGFLVKWEIRLSREEKVNGTIFFTPETLRAAFGLTDEHSMMQSCLWLIREHGCDVGYQARFIRWKEYLNIPHPGTGHDGDPNISIEIYPKVQEAVTQLLDECFPETKD